MRLGHILFSFSVSLYFTRLEYVGQTDTGQVWTVGRLDGWTVGGTDGLLDGFVEVCRVYIRSHIYIEGNT